MKKKSPVRYREMRQYWMTTDSTQPSQRWSSTFIHLSFHPPPLPFVSLCTFIEKTLCLSWQNPPPCSDIGQSNEARFEYLYACGVCVEISIFGSMHCKAPVLVVSSPLCVLIDLQVENELWTADSTPSLTDLTCRSITVLILIPLTRCVWDSEDMSAHYSVSLSHLYSCVLLLQRRSMFTSLSALDSASDNISGPPWKTNRPDLEWRCVRNVKNLIGRAGPKTNFLSNLPKPFFFC